MNPQSDVIWNGRDVILLQEATADGPVQYAQTIIVIFQQSVTGNEMSYDGARHCTKSKKGIGDVSFVYK